MSSASGRQIDPAQVRARLDAVIAEMKRLGIWELERPDSAPSPMELEAWLRWTFVPKIEALLLSGGPWPEESSVAVIAMRAADANPPPTPERVASLMASLDAFDALFEG